jgi:DNA-binding transcriptional LysR family regulator
MPLEFRVGASLRTMMLPASMTVAGAETYTAAAVAGLGLIQAPRYRMQRYFSSGELVPLLEEFPPSPSPVSILYPRAKQLSPRLRAFIDWATKALEVR